MFIDKENPVSSGIVILDFGSQYTMLIARRLREMGIFCKLVDGTVLEAPQNFKISGIILSGGPDSVTETGSRILPAWVLSSGVPVLGICYGLQLLVQKFGGKLRSGIGREYGRAKVEFTSELGSRAAQCFYGLPTQQFVWMSHGDDVERLPKDFVEIAKTADGVCAAMVHTNQPILGLQFHPEVHHTEFGSKILEQFARQLCRAELNWKTEHVHAAAVRYIENTVGPKDRVVMAVSGGVDSTVAAALLTQTLGAERVDTVFVDHGFLRAREASWVYEHLRASGLKNLTLLDRQELFLRTLTGVSDPETKRKKIGGLFVESFQEFAKARPGVTFLGQGTLYPDVIESAGDGAGSKVIKTHHNVGGLGDGLNLKLVEPLRMLFKDEVRRLGAAIGVDQVLLRRHPFPGPGLAIRVIGAIDQESIERARAADEIFIGALEDAKIYDDVWQAFVVLLPVKSVGVMGDNRSYEQSCVLRAVTASDGMTADVANLSHDFLVRVADQIVRKVKGINRVCFDITSKPPGTIEWE